MLIELSIRDFAIIDELRVAFAPGLNVLTGETGAGKSIIIDALGAVLGERIGPDVVRTGARAAHVEATFAIGNLTNRPDIGAFLEEFALERDEGTLILAREVAAGGRTTARINGRATTAGALARAGALLVDIHGQSDHLSLLRQSAHLDVLDRFAGALPAREALAELVREYREVRSALDRLASGERERERRIDLLTFQAGEIADAAPQPGEHERLAREREVLTNAERLVADAELAYALLTGGEATDGGAPAGIEAVRAASVHIDAVAQVDQAAAELADRLREALFLLEDAAVSVRDYRERVEVDPERLEAVDERLDLLKRLQRKYGATIDEVIAYGEQAQAELEQLTGGSASAPALQERADELLVAIGERGGTLSETRWAAARELEAGVERAITELNMGRARFGVAIQHRPSADGAPVTADGRNERLAFDETGFDRVEFLLAANTGEALKPLARVASGGEMARLMLALKSMLASADETPTLVFDEVDVGVGGRSGQVVGEKLWGLTRGHQVVVITHLPQIAAFAEEHLRITKGERAGRIVSDVVAVSGDERVDEIAAMLDGLPVTDAARANARQMLERAETLKRGAGSGARR